MSYRVSLDGCLEERQPLTERVLILCVQILKNRFDALEHRERICPEKAVLQIQPAGISCQPMKGKSLHGRDSLHFIGRIGGQVMVDIMCRRRTIGFDTRK